MLTNYNGVLQLLLVAEKLEIPWQSARPPGTIGKRGTIEAEGKVAGVLKLNRKEEGCGNVRSLFAETTCVVAARRNLVGPEVLTIRIGLAIQEVVIVLADKCRGIVD